MIYHVNDRVSDEEYNRSGTFLYPPYPRSAMQLISFYETREPTDDQLAKFCDGYASARAEWAQAELEAIDTQLIRTYGAGTTRTNEEHWKAVRDLEVQHPTLISPVFARDIAKIVQMRRMAQFLPTEECHRVIDHRTSLANGEYWRVADIAERYFWDRFPAYLV